MSYTRVGSYLTFLTTISGKAEKAIGLAEDKVESRLNSTGSSSDVEKALQKRYEPKELENKSLEKYLEERYKPIDP